MQYSDERISDLLKPPYVDTASGDIGRQQLGASIKSVWTQPLPGEDTAPEQRIIHCRIVELAETVKLYRIGVRKALGYHKCGSHDDLDWITSFRLLAFNEGQWDIVRYEKGIREPENDEIIWFDLNGVPASSVIIEARSCGIDEWWTGWNLTEDAFILEGSEPHNKLQRKENRHTSSVSLTDDLPDGLTAEMNAGEVRYRSRFLEVGFCLGKSGFSYLSLDETGNGKTERNLLRYQPGMNLQGIRLHPVGQHPFSGLFLRYEVDGKTSVNGNTVTYEMEIPKVGQTFRLEWKIFADRLVLNAERTGSEDLEVWESAFWNISLYSEVSPSSTLGKITKEGETGILTTPSILHVPGYGSLKIDSDNQDILLRSDSIRPFKTTVLQFKLGEEPTYQGSYLLKKGTFSAETQINLHAIDSTIIDGSPTEVRDALNRTTLTSMTYRPDTATLSNNGNSMHCPISMDNWSGLAKRIGLILPGFHAMDMVKESLQRWLDGAPGYASGRMLDNNGFHQAEDEYIMTGTASLLGLAEMLEYYGTSEWLDRFQNQIRNKLSLMKDRDVDNDGIVESSYRLGVSGKHHWSTCWFDVVSFGWKDAFSNTLLYTALKKLNEQFTRLNHPELTNGLEEWADKLQINFEPTFYNPDTGWLAGWRCKENKLHDHGFLFVNGAAVNAGLVSEKMANAMMQRLWKESQKVGLKDYQWGLPGNLWQIPDDDMVDIMHGVSMGHYANGGRTHSQSRHFVSALYRVGMEQEADSMLHQLCESMADCTAFGGLNTGVDWRYWDGWPCGYEGLLTDQFGILMVAMDRYGKKDR